jgi:spore coat protein E
MYREIVTKAVVGKGKIANDGEVIVNTSNSISKVLGCWVINHYYVSSFDNGKVLAKGKYDVHVWYGYNKDSETAIHKQTVDYNEEFSLNIKQGQEISENNEFIVKCSKYPTCNSLVLNLDGSISVKIEKELLLDIIGEAKLRVQISTDEECCDDINNIDVDYLNRG